MELELIKISKIEKAFDFTKREINKYIQYNYFKKKYGGSQIHKIFEYIHKKYTTKIAEESIKLASLSYIKKNLLLQHLKRRDLIFSKDDFNKSKYFIIQNPLKNKIIVVFRGTNYLSDIIKDFTYFRTPFDFIDKSEKKKFIEWRNKTIYKNKDFDQTHVPLKKDEDIELHYGFYYECKHLFPELMNILLEIIKNNNSKKTEILFLGHSMGIISSIISLMTRIELERLKKRKEIKNKMKDIKIYNVTLNSPTIGNKNYNLLKFYYKIDKTFQFINQEDFFVSYGYKLTFDFKKIRHTNWMLKKNYILFNNCYYEMIDYGYLLDEWIDKHDIKNKIKNMVLVFHGYMKIPHKKKLLLI